MAWEVKKIRGIQELRRELVDATNHASPATRVVDRERCKFRVQCIASNLLHLRGDDALVQSAQPSGVGRPHRPPAHGRECPAVVDAGGPHRSTSEQCCGSMRQHATRSSSALAFVTAGVVVVAFLSQTKGQGPGLMNVLSQRRWPRARVERERTTY